MKVRRGAPLNAARVCLVRGRCPNNAFLSHSPSVTKTTGARPGRCRSTTRFAVEIRLAPVRKRSRAPRRWCRPFWTAACGSFLKRKCRRRARGLYRPGGSAIDNDTVWTPWRWHSGPFAPHFMRLCAREKLKGPCEHFSNVSDRKYISRVQGFRSISNSFVHVDRRPFARPPHKQNSAGKIGFPKSRISPHGTVPRTIITFFQDGIVRPTPVGGGWPYAPVQRVQHTRRTWNVQSADSQRSAANNLLVSASKRSRRVKANYFRAYRQTCCLCLCRRSYELFVKSPFCSSKTNSKIISHNSLFIAISRCDFRLFEYFHEILHFVAVKI